MTQGRETSDRAHARVRELERRKEELEKELGAFYAAEEDREKIQELEAEIAELESLLEQSRREAGMTDNMEKLETVEKAVASAGADFRKAREEAERIYGAAVAAIMKRDGCSESVAHGRAAADPVASRAYAAVVEMQERERTARDGAGRIGAYLG